MMEIKLQNHLWYFGFQIDLGGVNTLRHGFAWIEQNTVKPVCNDHLYNKIYYLWFIQ